MHPQPSSPDLDTTNAVATHTWIELRAALAELLGEDVGADYLVEDASPTRRWLRRARRGR